MKNRVILIQSHLDCIESEYQMGGLSSGLYGEYANDVAVAFACDLLKKLRDDGDLNMTDQEIHNLLQDCVHVVPIEK